MPLTKYIKVNYEQDSLILFVHVCIDETFFLLIYFGKLIPNLEKKTNY